MQISSHGPTYLPCFVPRPCNTERADRYYYPVLSGFVSIIALLAFSKGCNKKQTYNTKSPAAFSDSERRGDFLANNTRTRIRSRRVSNPFPPQPIREPKRCKSKSIVALAVMVQERGTCLTRLMDGTILHSVPAVAVQ